MGFIQALLTDLAVAYYYPKKYKIWWEDCKKKKAYACFVFWTIMSILFYIMALLIVLMAIYAVLPFFSVASEVIYHMLNAGMYIIIPLSVVLFLLCPFIGLGVNWNTITSAQINEYNRVGAKSEGLSMDEWRYHRMSFLVWYEDRTMHERMDGTRKRLYWLRDMPEDDRFLPFKQWYARRVKDPRFVRWEKEWLEYEKNTLHEEELYRDLKEKEHL